MVERDLAKVDVAGSTPVSRSSFSSVDPCRIVVVSTTSCEVAK